MSRDGFDIVREFINCRFCRLETEPSTALHIVGAVDKRSLGANYRRLTSLDDTLGGGKIYGMMTQYKLPDVQRKILLDEAAIKFIGHASGNLTVALGNSIADTSFFSRHIPVILDNPDLYSVNGIDKETLGRAYRQMDRHRANVEQNIVDVLQGQSSPEMLFRAQEPPLRERERLKRVAALCQAIEETGGKELAHLVKTALQIERQRDRLHDDMRAEQRKEWGLGWKQRSIFKVWGLYSERQGIAKKLGDTQKRQNACLEKISEQANRLYDGAAQREMVTKAQKILDRDFGSWDAPIVKASEVKQQVEVTIQQQERRLRRTIEVKGRKGPEIGF